MRMWDQLQTGWRFNKGLPSSSHGSFFVCVCWKLPLHWLWVSVLSAMDDKMLLLWVGNINRKVTGRQTIEKYHVVWWTKYKEQVDHILQGLIRIWSFSHHNFLCVGKLFVIQSLGLTSVTHPVSTLIRKGACEKKWSSIYILESQYDLALMYIFSIMSFILWKGGSCNKGDIT